MSSKRSKKKKLRSNKTPKTKPRKIFSPLDRDGPYKNSPRSSPFLRLPGEIRNEIYLALFSSTRISFGEVMQKGKKTLRVLPAKYSLSLLHTCRQIYIEANPLWPGQILVHFGSMGAMVDKINSLPPATREEIRQLRVRWNYQPTYIHYFMHSWPLHTLYKLCLDRLIVLFDKKNGQSDDHLFNIRIMFELTTYGHGWKELHCLINSGSILSELPKSPDRNYYLGQVPFFPSIDQNSLRARRIFTTEEYIKMNFLERDGTSSDASIKICRSKTCAHFGSPSMMDSASYMEVDRNKPLTPAQLKTSCKWALLVAKRASNANVMSPTRTHPNENPVLTWTAVKKKLSQTSRPAMQYAGKVYDRYKSPLDYSWQSSKNQYRKKKKPCM